MSKSASVLAPVLLIAAPLLAAAQEPTAPSIDWEKLARNATSRVEVTIDGPLLQSVAGFVAGDKQDAADLKRILSGLRGVYVHSYEFDRDNAYSPQDVEAARAVLTHGHWARIVQSFNRDDNEHTEIYLKQLARSTDTPGLFIVAAGARELTVVHIAGELRPEDAGKLSGVLGIPDLGSSKTKAAKAQ